MSEARPARCRAPALRVNERPEGARGHRLPGEHRQQRVGEVTRDCRRVDAAELRQSEEVRAQNKRVFLSREKTHLENRRVQVERLDRLRDAHALEAPRNARHERHARQDVLGWGTHKAWAPVELPSSAPPGPHLQCAGHLLDGVPVARVVPVVTTEE